MFFCDWLNVWQQFPPEDYPDFVGGRVISVDGQCDFLRRGVVDQDTGEISDAWAVCGSDDVEYSTAKFEQHRGSYETTIMIRMVAGRLEVRGNPSAWGRLDNLFGVSLDDGIAVYNHVLAGLGLPQFTEGEVQKVWLCNEEKFATEYTGAHVTRADLTINQAVGMGRVRDYNKWLAGQKFSRGSANDKELEKFAQWEWSTVYTAISKLWMETKHYDKARALEDVTLPNYKKKLGKAVRAGKIQRSEVRSLLLEAGDYLGKLAEWCAEKGIVRSEWSVRSRWFAQHEGSGFWKPGETEGNLLDVVQAEREKISMRAVVYQQDSYSALSKSERCALFDWKQGQPLRAVLGGSLPDTTFYRLRSSILKKTGHDIAARPLVSQSQVEFRPVYFQVRPLSLADVPSWYQRPFVPDLLAA